MGKKQVQNGQCKVEEESQRTEITFSKATEKSRPCNAAETTDKQINEMDQITQNEAQREVN